MCSTPLDKMLIGEKTQNGKLPPHTNDQQDDHCQLGWPKIPSSSSLSTFIKNEREKKKFIQRSEGGIAKECNFTRNKK